MEGQRGGRALGFDDFWSHPDFSVPCSPVNPNQCPRLSGSPGRRREQMLFFLSCLFPDQWVFWGPSVRRSCSRVLGILSKPP